ncbi:Diaphanous autoregulatory [Penicillium argentinense]|uniref:Diaphanous autoregulatory n=1 Tax=Penicillium argentinense TaxID=1131581 RepID=A0A9W9KBQ6_9EURO|nr:Diaphanous autoregulatory [Penicillium argentinense]KAJ5099182.1 Diaphanous autoregulatory [Penicillium argentinense]
MDSLLEKLRAAAPQAKDQRDRRRRARLKERHQVRVASGQHVPDGGAEEGNNENDNAAKTEAATDENGLLSPPLPEEGENTTMEAQTSEGEDIADRAASMLLGLRSNSDAGGERQRRRRESADEERRNRRMRRRNGATSGSKDSADGSGLPPVQEPMSPSRTDSIGTEDQAPPSPPQDGSQASAPPSIVVSDQHDDQHKQEHSADGTSASHPIELSD